MKKCVKCKLEFNDEFAFCPECGSKLEKKDDKLDLFEGLNDSDTTDLSNLDDLFNLDNVTYDDNNNENISLDSLDNDLMMQAELAYSKNDHEKAKKIYEQLLENTNYSLDILEKYIKLISINYIKVDFSLIPLVIKSLKNKDFSKHIKNNTEFYNYINEYKIYFISLFRILLHKIYIQKNDADTIKLLTEIKKQKEKEEKEANFQKNAYTCKMIPPERRFTFETTLLGMYNNNPIKWTCIGTYGYCLLLITSNMLDEVKFNENGCSSYEDSSLRKYLNNDFYNNCFSDKEKEIILKHPKTLDNVFLLSADECRDRIYEREEQHFIKNFWTKDIETGDDGIIYSKVYKTYFVNSKNQNDKFGLFPCILVKRYNDDYLPYEDVKEKLEYEKEIETTKKAIKLNEEKNAKEANQLSLFNYEKRVNKYYISGLSEIGKNIKNLDLVIPPLDIEINENAFAEMQTIRSVTINANIKKLNPRTFYNCHNLEKVNLNNELMTIQKECFSGTNLKEIDLKNVVQIDEYAFANCPLKSFVFTRFIESFNILALENCNDLENISSENEKFYIDKDSIIYQKYQQNAFALIGSISKEKTLHVLNIVKNKKVEVIDINAFKGNKFIEQLYGNENIRIIAPHAFENCINLKRIDGFPNLESINECAFQNDYNLEEVLSFDNSIINVGYHAFNGCKSLKKLYVSKHSTIHDEAFDNKIICKKRLFK